MLKQVENERFCRNCRFYSPEGGECRRNPPQVWADETDVGYCFPRVSGGMWCGEFQSVEKYIFREGFDLEDKPEAGIVYEITN